MICPKCRGRGFIEQVVLRDANPDGQGLLLQCCDVSKYSDEVARRLNNRLRAHKTDETKARRELGFEELGTVLPFRRRENERL